MNLLSVFLALSIIEAIPNLLLASSNRRGQQAQDRIFVKGLISSTGTLIFYCISLYSTQYFWISFYSSLYFICIDCMLYYMAEFFLYYVGGQQSRGYTLVKRALGIYVLFDTVTMLINPFHEFVLTYRQSPTWNTHYYYEPYALYQLHLIYSYLCIAIILYLLIRKMYQAPHEYSFKYRVCIVAIIGVVIGNAAFLYFPYRDLLDFAVLFYAPIFWVIYWAWKYYPRMKIQPIARRIIVEEMEQALVLFDFEGSLAMVNHQAAFLRVDRNIRFEQFLRRYHLEEQIKDVTEDTHFLCRFDEAEEDTFRCDYRCILDEKGRMVCRFFVFTNTSLDVDLLTGFYTNLHYLDLPELEGTLQYPAALAVCDLNRLAYINKTYGREEGDRAIRTVAQKLKQTAPEGTQFYRLADANLLLVSPATDLSTMRQYTEHLREMVSQEHDRGGSPLEVQTAICVVSNSQERLEDAMQTALKSMRTKKLMDRNSGHASLLDSMEEMLKESDPTTAEHVARTQLLGEKLGMKIGLTDMELSNLRLLCLLHDIGKVGIPLEILNKPYRLEENEWKVITEHVEKGYRIAKSSEELADIADHIRHHHEKWDGTGYPDGLSRESIPLLARIIAIIDTYDAMTNDRPYRKAVSWKTALNELKSCAGTQFDPSIVNEFVSMVEEEMQSSAGGEQTADQTQEELVRPRGYAREEPADSAEPKENLSEMTFISYTLDEEFFVEKIDEEFTLFTGYTEEDIRQYRLRQLDLLPLEDQRLFERYLQDMITRRRLLCLEHRLTAKDGTEKYVYSTIRMFYDSVARRPRFEAVVVEMTAGRFVKRWISEEEKREERKLDSWMNTVRKDPLTGVLTRIAYKNDVEMKLIEGRGQMALFMLDIDHFKQYNDTYGHLTGDEILKHLAEAAAQQVETYGIVGRMGGDEFSIFLNVEAEAPLDSIAATLFETISDKLQTYHAGVTISMGGVRISESISTFREAYRLADEALYKAKGNGRNQLVMMPAEE